MASDIVPGRIMTSKSGTLAYLAPEVYSGKGYDIRADWWSLGVLFYECIYNKVCLRFVHVSSRIEEKDAVQLNFTPATF